jgi:uncharacterized protein
VILVDVNLLIYAVNQDAPLHREAKAWLESILSGEEVLGLSWIVVLAFLRLTTRSGLFTQPLSIEAALDLVQLWLDCEAVRLVHPGPKHAKIFRELLLKSGAGGNLTSDAHLAALAIEHDAELCSADRDFARFSGLRWRDPLTVR